MSKVVLVCSRNPSRDSEIPDILRHLSADLVPDNIEPTAPEIARHNNVHMALINPNSIVMRHGRSVLLGHLVGSHQDWWRAGAPVPDGAYGLFRVDSNKVELVTDRLGSRTIFYVITDDLFVASTSQRAIIMLLGSYEPNLDAAMWLLSAGHLGPGNSWDRRIKAIAPDSTLTFNITAWTSSIYSRPAVFAEEKLPAEEHKERLLQTVKKVFANLNVDYTKVALPLSGGFDSRALLMMVRDKGLNRCVTWGLKQSRSDSRNDAYIAEQVARYFGVDHQYLYTDMERTDASVETVFERILISGEGRVARISGYTDGFAIWKSLYEQGIEAILRGDMAFGVDPAVAEFEIRRLGRLTILSDFRNLPDALIRALPPQSIEAEFLRRPGETLETWRDRCYQTNAVPNVLAGLTELKSSYVEVINPLLSSSVIDCIRTHPDSLRTDKFLWKEIVRKDGPDIPFAETAAPASVDQFMKKKDAVHVILSELDAIDAPDVISGALTNFIKENMRISENQEVRRSRFRKALRPYVSPKIRGLTRQFQRKNILEINTLGFRAFLVCKMARMLRRDADLYVQ